MTLQRARLACAAAVLAGSGPLAHGWGFAAHRLVNAKAAQTLPAPLDAFFAGNAAYLREHSIDPDLWRTAGVPEEAPNHFLDLDAFGQYPFDVAEDEQQQRARHGRESARFGRVPWRVGEAYQALVTAYRKHSPAQVLREAAALGHYLGDAHAPLHAVLNYDGQLSGQRGLHERWETDLFERFEVQLEARVRPRPAARSDDPVALTLGVLRAASQGAATALGDDLAARGPRDLVETPHDDRYDDAYYSRLYARQGDLLAERLTASAEAVATLWHSAWHAAGRPELDWSYREPYVRGRSRAVLVTLDGAGAGVIDDAVARGWMPHLAALRRGGAVARGSQPGLPVKTAAAHAALYTGAWGDVNGITGNGVPRPAAPVAEWESGFTSRQLRAEPLWVTAARQGLHATTVSSTQSYPFEPFLDERRFGGSFANRLTLIDGFQGLEQADRALGWADLRGAQPPAELAPHEGTVRAFELDVAGARVTGLLFDDPGDPAAGFDTLSLRSGESSARLKAAPTGAGPEAFAPLRLALPAGPAALFFRLFALSADGRELLLYHTNPALLRSRPAGVAAAALEATGGFVPGRGTEAYASGALGPPLWTGGDGTAETRYLEIVALTVRQFQRLDELALERSAGRLIITYLPFPDEFSHLWLGLLDASVPGHDAALAGRLRPYFERGLRLVDDHVGFLVGKLGPDDVLAVAADHGQAPAFRTLRPNVALRAAGLVALDAQGQADLARTRALYFPGNGGYVLLNRASRPAGIVTPDQEDVVRREVVKALVAIRDPLTGAQLVPAVRDAALGPGEHGLGGPQGGDLYLSLAPGTDLTPDLEGELVTRGRPWGHHIADPERPEMWATLQFYGAGVATGVDLGLVRHVDVAPTLCALLGLDPPAHSVGRVLSRALARGAPDSPVP